MTEQTETEEQDVAEQTEETPEVEESEELAETTDNAPEETEEEPEEEAETFSRDYVVKLRKEAADARVKAKDRDTLATALWTAHVTATGRLADPTDLVMPDDADPLDEDAVTTALDDLLERKPHLASRKPRGSVGQGATTGAEPVDLAALMRGRV